jgi:hypothetical protein
MHVIHVFVAALIPEVRVVRNHARGRRGMQTNGRDAFHCVSVSFDGRCVQTGPLSSAGGRGYQCRRFLVRTPNGGIRDDVEFVLTVARRRLQHNRGVRFDGEHVRSRAIFGHRFGEGQALRHPHEMPAEGVEAAGLRAACRSFGGACGLGGRLRRGFVIPSIRPPTGVGGHAGTPLPDHQRAAPPHRLENYRRWKKDHR